MLEAYVTGFRATDEGNLYFQVKGDARTFVITGGPTQSLYRELALASFRTRAPLRFTVGAAAADYWKVSEFYFGDWR